MPSTLALATSGCTRDSVLAGDAGASQMFERAGEDGGRSPSPRSISWLRLSSAFRTDHIHTICSPGAPYRTVPRRPSCSLDPSVR